MKRSSDVGVRPWQFPIGSPQSRAAARLAAERITQEKKRIEIVFDCLLPNIRATGHDPSKPFATPWYENPKGELVRSLFVPPGMSPEEAKRIVDAPDV